MPYINGEGIADNLLREFRAMSSERDRRCRPSSVPAMSRTSSVAFMNSAYRSPLRYSSEERYRRPYGGDPWKGWGVGSYMDDRYPSRWHRHRYTDGGEVAAPPVAEIPLTSLSQWSHSQDVRGSPSSRPTRHRQNERSYRRAAASSPSSSSASRSYYTGSTSDSSECDATSVERERESRSVRSSRARSPKQGDVPSRAKTHRNGMDVHQRTTPSRLPPEDVPPPGVIRWVDGDQKDEGRAMSRGTMEAKQRQVVVRSPPESQHHSLPPQMPSRQPSTLLRRVIESVVFYRGVSSPSSVPSEVVLAFDEYVSRGSMMLKFISHGPPHPRFFAIRFLDVVAASLRLRDGNAHHRGPATPHAVLAWYHTSASRHMIRYLPLHDLIEVKADGTDHRYVRRRMVQPGVLRGPRSSLVTEYVRADHILQFHFSSQISRAEETLALKAANRTHYLAWLVVGSFISQLGKTY